MTIFENKFTMMKATRAATCVLSALTFWSLILSSNALFNKKSIKLERVLGMCPGYKNLTFQIRDVSFSHSKKDFWINLKFYVVEESSDDLKIKMIINRCSSKEALDSCEPYPDIKLSKVCNMFNLSLPPFKGGLDQIHPKLLCPFKKGVYVLTNGTVDQGSLTILPIDGWYWKMHIKLFQNFDGDYKLIGCTYLEGTIINI